MGGWLSELGSRCWDEDIPMIHRQSPIAGDLRSVRANHLSWSLHRNSGMIDDADKPRSCEIVADVTELLMVAADQPCMFAHLPKHFILKSALITCVQDCSIGVKLLE